MKTMRIAPSFRYQLRDLLLGFAPFFGVFVILMTGGLIFAGVRAGNSTISYSGFGAAAAICVFVIGVVSPRLSLRLHVQMGVSRRTAFIAQLLAVVVSTLALGAAGEVLLAVGQALNHNANFFLGDLYQMIYGSIEMPMTLSQHLCSGLFNTALMLLTFAAGMFTTFLFWRLNKFWTVVVAISIPLLLNLIPLALYRAAELSEGVRRAVEALMAFLGHSCWNAMGFLVALAGLFTVFAWLLVYRANIRAPQGK